MRTITFDLLDNARDSLRHAVDQLTSIDGVTSSEYKHAILSVSHAVELLLKERLARIHPAFVWENVDRYPSLEARTVAPARAIARLRKIAGVEISEKDEAALLDCRVMRNAIEHHRLDVSVREAKIVLGRALSFLFDFGRYELGVDLEEDFKADDTWIALVTELYEFAEAHGVRVASRLAEQGIPTDECEHCGAVAVDLMREVCTVCGHLWDTEGEDR